MRFCLNRKLKMNIGKFIVCRWFIISVCVFVVADFPMAIGESRKNCADFDSSSDEIRRVDEFVARLREAVKSHRTIQLTVTVRSADSNEYQISHNTTKVWRDSTGDKPKFRDEYYRKVSWGDIKSSSRELKIISDGEYVYSVGDLSPILESEELKVTRSLALRTPDFITGLIDSLAASGPYRRLVNLSDGTKVIESCRDGSSFELRRRAVFDEQTGFLVEGFERNSSGATQQYTVTDIVTNAKISPDLFRYTVPDGVTVRDNTKEGARLKMMLDAMGKDSL